MPSAVHLILPALVRRPPQERLYWLHRLPKNSHNPPSTYAKLHSLNSAEPKESRREENNGFFGKYFTIARRELHKEPTNDASLLCPQFDPVVLRGMIQEEITAAFCQAKSTIEAGISVVRDHKKPLDERRNRLRAAIASLENRVKPVTITVDKQPRDQLKNLSAGGYSQRWLYLRILGKKTVAPANSFLRVKKDEKFETKQKQLVGSDDLKIVKNWDILTQDSADHQPLKPQTEGVIQNAVMPSEDKTLSKRELLLSEESEENSLLVKLVIDSGHKYFYFDIGGDSDEEEDVSLSQERFPLLQTSQNNDVIRPASTSSSSFKYYEERYETMKGSSYKEWAKEEQDRVLHELRKNVKSYGSGVERLGTSEQNQTSESEGTEILTGEKTKQSETVVTSKTGENADAK